MVHTTHPISDSVVKLDHSAKISGRARYLDDLPMDGVLTGRMLRSDRARARILAVHLPPLPEGYCVVDRRDVPGDNNVNIVKDDCPVFARDTVEFIGEAILMVAGPDPKEVERLLGEIRVEYEDLPPVLDPAESDTVFFEYHYAKGDTEAAFREADHVFTETFRTGYQEQAYLETQSMQAEPHPDGKVTVRGSMQCPYYVFSAVNRVMGGDPGKVQICQEVTGGAFGGKEDYPSIIGCQVAVAARKAGKPVRLVLDRREDMTCTNKRHPSVGIYKVAVKGGKVTAMEIDFLLNGGAYTTLSAVVLQRTIISSPGVYFVPNLKVRGRAVKTNTVPNGAFRGFGGPQGFFGAEMMMDHIARKLGVNPLEFRVANLARQGDSTSTGGRYHFHVPLPEMLEQVDAMSDFRRKWAEYEKPQTGRYRRGIGLSFSYHGAGFTGNGERDLIKAVLRMRKNADDTVEILTAGTDMGQGLKTALVKIAARELDVPLEQVRIQNPDTDRVPDSGPTVASRSTMIVGELVRRAACRLKEIWKSGRVLEVEEHYVHPEFLIPFDAEAFTGDAYPTYSWTVQVVELEVDTLTAVPKVLGAWGSFDVGTPIDEKVVIGQMEGGFLQGIGMGGMEYAAADGSGRIRNASFADYLIPTSMDVPHMECVLNTAEYPEGPYGAKGAGELPTVGGASAYLQAMEQCMARPLNHVPYTMDDIMAGLREVEA